jgi:beta-galactosidase
MPKDFLTRLSQAAHQEFPFSGFFTAADSWDALPAGMELPYNTGDDKRHPPVPEDMAFFQREYGDWVDNFSIHNSPVRVKREWGEHAMNLQADIREDQINGLYATPVNKIGGALWAGIDHQRGYNPDPFWGGLLDMYRVPRYSYYLYKSQYAPDLKVPGISTGPMVYICHELTYISEPDVVVYTNCQQVHLTWLGKDFGTQGPDTSHHEPHPPVIFKDVFDIHRIGNALNKGNQMHRLEMVAEGLINGQVVCSETKEYPERTTGLRLEVENHGVPLQADGSDFVPVRAYIVDEYGTTRVLDSSYVTFHVDGPGEIIGGEANNGNPMKSEFGIATALVRAGLTPGTLHITATTDGLKPGAIDIQSVPPSLPLLPAPSPGP